MEAGLVANFQRDMDRCPTPSEIRFVSVELYVHRTVGESEGAHMMGIQNGSGRVENCDSFRYRYLWRGDRW